MPFIVAIFWNDQIKRSLTTLKTKPRPSSSLPLPFVSSAASVATMLSPATALFLHLTKSVQGIFGKYHHNKSDRLAFVHSS